MQSGTTSLEGIFGNRQKCVHSLKQQYCNQKVYISVHRNVFHSIMCNSKNLEINQKPINMGLFK